MLLDVDYSYNIRSLEPWQRVNRIPALERHWNNKAWIIQGWREYQKTSGKEVLFVPDAYRLSNPADQKELLARLEARGGMDLPWILRNTVNAKGKRVAMIAPRSKELKTLHKNMINNDPMMKFITDKEEPNKKTSTKPAADKRETNKPVANMESSKHDVLQEYICDQITTPDGHSFDVKVYWFVASYDPLIVYFHEGLVRVAPNSPDNKTVKNHPTAQSDLRPFFFLEQYVNEYHAKLSSSEMASDSRKLPTTIDMDPYIHVCQQIKAAIAQFIEAFQRSGFDLSSFPMENSFMLGEADFVIDKNLNVWLLEVQKGPALKDNNNSFRQNVLDDMLPTMLHMVEEVVDKQEHGEPLLPFRDGTGSFELIYSQESKYQFEYEFGRTKEKPSTCGRGTS
jgi:hypothetical protein